MMWHWVGHSKYKCFDVYEFFDRKVVLDELGSNLNDSDKTENSVVAD